MNRFELNIGMAGNALSLQGIISEVYDALGRDCIEGFRLSSGEYNGEMETNVIIKGRTAHHLAVIVRSLANLAGTMRQESIAFASDDADLLIYNLEFQGDKVKFNEEYFVRY